MTTPSGGVPTLQATDVYQRAVAFEKQHGDRAGIEDVIVGERRFQYEEEVAKNPRNYDTWFDYCRLEENAGDPDKVREVWAAHILSCSCNQRRRDASVCCLSALLPVGFRSRLLDAVVQCRSVWWSAAPLAH